MCVSQKVKILETYLALKAECSGHRKILKIRLCR